MASSDDDEAPSPGGAGDGPKRKLSNEGKGSTGLGATDDEWAMLIALGLAEDLLPCVSDQAARISPASKLKEIGKAPSIFNSQGFAVGFPKWTSHRATAQDIERWRQEPRHGVCVQTRAVRALDVDVTDAALAAEIADLIEAYLPGAARRGRSNSSKFLIPIQVANDLDSEGKPIPLTKRRMLVGPKQAIEFLADGQHFVASGMHPSGVRYQWDGLEALDLIGGFYSMTVEQFDRLWDELAERFALREDGAVVTAKATRAAGVRRASDALPDPMADYLIANGWAIDRSADGKLYIRCPWEEEHTADTGITATAYFPRGIGGFEQGHFRCLHQHCTGRGDHDFKQAIGFDTDGFEDLDAADGKRRQFEPLSVGEFVRSRPVASWHVQGVIPKAELGVIFGESGSGKSFWVLSLVHAIATGTPWRGRATEQGSVVYVPLEGQYDFALRLKALAEHHGVTVDELPFRVVVDDVNLARDGDESALGREIKAAGGADLIVLDTLAQATPGANENSGEDMGAALARAKRLHRLTGATVVMIHHSGKDSTKGARGWSGLRAAVDFELEVVRAGEKREAIVTKLRGGPDGERFPFRLVVVPLGIDEQDTPISSCVVEHVDAAQIPKVRQPKGRVQKLVLSEARRLAAIEGHCSIEDVLDTVSPMLAHDPKKKDQRRGTVQKAITALAEQGFLTVAGERIEFDPAEGELLEDENDENG